jgi:hypothetical protein
MMANQKLKVTEYFISNLFQSSQNIEAAQRAAQLRDEYIAARQSEIFEIDSEKLDFVVVPLNQVHYNIFAVISFSYFKK